MSASAIGVRDDSAAAFLGFIATVPYDDSRPDSARAWVATTLTEDGTRHSGALGSR